jgi:hypothetical protein
MVYFYKIYFSGWLFNKIFSLVTHVNFEFSPVPSTFIMLKHFIKNVNMCFYNNYRIYNNKAKRYLFNITLLECLSDVSK